SDTDRKLRLIDLVGPGADRELAAVPNPYPSNLVFSPDGKTLALVAGDRSLSLFDVATGAQTRPVMPGPAGPSTAQLHFSPDSRRLATGGANTTTLIWKRPAAARPARTRETDGAAWGELEALDAAQAFEGMRHLLAEPAAAVKLIRDRLEPPPAGDKKRIARLIGELDDDSYARRQKASEELAGLGAAAAGALKEARRGGSGGVEQRATSLPPR